MLKAAPEESDMQKHPNEFSRRQILKFCAGRRLDAEVTAVESGYVIFLRRFSFVEACIVSEPAGRLVYDEDTGLWKLYWMTGRYRWHLYDRYGKLLPALEAMLGDKAASLFQKVL